MRELSIEEKKKMIPVERMIVLQGYVDYYLVLHQGKTFQELYPDIKDEYGVLNEKQVEILHHFMVEEYKAKGVDLDDAIKAAGETVNENHLSKLEEREILRIADREICLIGLILKRKKSLYKNK